MLRFGIRNQIKLAETPLLVLLEQLLLLELSGAAWTRIFAFPNHGGREGLDPISVLRGRRQRWRRSTVLVSSGQQSAQMVFPTSLLERWPRGHTAVGVTWGAVWFHNSISAPGYSVVQEASSSTVVTPTPTGYSDIHVHPAGRQGGQGGSILVYFNIGIQGREAVARPRHKTLQKRSEFKH